MPKYYGGIEAGGTKFVCAIGSGPDDILAENRFSTTSPSETLGKTVEFFQRYEYEFPLESIGIASFGPVDLNPESTTYGYITKTPKPDWSDCDVVGTLSKLFKTINKVVVEFVNFSRNAPSHGLWRPKRQPVGSFP